ncbi:MAG TPA: DoxX family protein [Cyclobacteriaceae bacterium]|nr:DoxX family protein [Cyclobacteriaceae bacterium]
MSVITNIEGWGNSHRPGWLDIFRIILGVFITFKGIEFMMNLDSLKQTAESVNLMFTGASLAHYIVFAHLLGGPLIVVGLFTRIVSLIQIPILIGAIIFVNYPQGFLSLGNHMELEVSIGVLAACIVFIVFGAGKFSIDERRRHDHDHVTVQP